MLERTSPPATLIISRVMRPGRDAAYDPWAGRIVAAAREQTAFRSAVRLDQAGELHHLLIQFDDALALTAWSEHRQFRELVADAEIFSVGLTQENHGTAVDFTLPSETAAKKWKTALVTWLGVVPTLLIVSGLIGWALPDAPRVLQQIISSVLLTGTLTWFILPRVRGWSRFWMMRNSQGNLRKKAS